MSILLTVLVPCFNFLSFLYAQAIMKVLLVKISNLVHFSFSNTCFVTVSVAVEHIKVNKSLYFNYQLLYICAYSNDLHFLALCSLSLWFSQWEEKNQADLFSAYKIKFITRDLRTLFQRTSLSSFMCILIYNVKCPELLEDFKFI